MVTGGSGFIGRHFILEILKKKKFNIFSLSQKKIKKKFQIKRVKYIFCKLQNKSLLKKKLNFKIHYAVNFAGHINHAEVKKTYQTHYIGLKNLADVLITKEIKKFLQIGSSVEYGFTKSPQKEKSNLLVKKMKSTYGKSKLLSTNYLLKLYEKKKFPVLILRPYLIYGPGQSLNRLIPITILNCLKNKKFDCSSGKQIRNFMYVKDFSKIVYTCCFLKIEGEIINVGSSRNYSVKFIINKIRKILNKGYPNYGKIKLRNDEPLNLFPNLNKLRKLIKFKNETSIQEGLKKTVLYYKNLNYEKNISY